MSKVWVPIDLPEGARVRDIIVEVGPGGPAHTRILEPLGPVMPDRAFFGFEGLARAVAAPPEQQRDRWEYKIMAATDLGDERFSPDAAEKVCNAFGVEGWECFHVNPGAVWFKRRLP